MVKDSRRPDRRPRLSPERALTWVRYRCRASVGRLLSRLPYLLLQPPHLVLASLKVRREPRHVSFFLREEARRSIELFLEEGRRRRSCCISSTTVLRSINSPAGLLQILEGRAGRDVRK